MTTTHSSKWSTTNDDGTRTAIGEALDRNPFRRFSEAEPADLPPHIFSQSMHIDQASGPPRRMLGGTKDEYFSHTLDSAKSEIDELLKYGINSLYLQLYPAMDRGPSAALDHFVEVVSTLRDNYGDDLRLEVDTAGLCMGADLRWGVRNATEEIDPHASLLWLNRTATQMANLGCNSLVVVGRMNYEALAARSGLNLASKEVELWGFSSNSETPNAYFDTGEFDADHALTHQKVHVGNVSEMLLRSLRDIYEGLEVVVQKPMENIALTTVLRLLIQGDLSLQQCFRFEDFEKTYSSSVNALGEDWLHTERLTSALPSTRLGVYEVSGTYSMFRMIEDQYSTPLARALMREQFLNLKWSMGPTLHRIVSRNALWYVKNA